VVRQTLAQHGRMDGELRRSLLERMGDVSDFMKELKQRYSRWDNRRGFGFAL
jgi:hypothetical protein